MTFCLAPEVFDTVDMIGAVGFIDEDFTVVDALVIKGSNIERIVGALTIGIARSSAAL